ncbi:MAG: co-chaperone GroES, partial [Lachnospiraceae bacterium]|nr:co-chaperone GroES [Lachnospiraceae bacterium]
DRIIIKEEIAEEKTESGIILTGSAKEKPSYATVVAVGPGGMVNGNEVKMQVKKGDKVMYAKFAGTEVKFEGEQYIILRQDDILAVIK